LESRESAIKLATKLEQWDQVKKLERIKEVRVSAPVLRRIAERSASRAEEFLVKVEGDCRELLRGVLPRKGIPYPAKDVAKRLAGEIRKYVEEVEPTTFATTNPRTRTVQTKRGPRKRRPMKVRDRAQYERWKKTRTPTVRYVREELAEEVGKKVRLKRRWQMILAETEYIRSENEALVDWAMQYDEITMLQWTSKRDGRVCSICKAYDLWTVRKRDPVVALYSPPAHPACRCKWLHIPKFAAKEYGLKPTYKRDWPMNDKDDPIELAPGYGGLR